MRKMLILWDVLQQNEGISNVVLSSRGAYDFAIKCAQTAKNGRRRPF